MGLSPASKKNFTSLLAVGYSCILIPGGVQETILMEHGSEALYYKGIKLLVVCFMVQGKKACDVRNTPPIFIIGLKPG